MSYKIQFDEVLIDGEWHEVKGGSTESFHFVQKLELRDSEHEYYVCKSRVIDQAPKDDDHETLYRRAKEASE